MLLDTTFLIDTDRSGAPLDGAIDDDDDVAIAAVTVAELLVGLELSDSHRRPQRQAFVDEILDSIPVLNYDTAVAASHAQLLLSARRQGKPRAAHDLIIAATARASQREIVSADALAFQDLPGVSVRTHQA